MKNETVICFDTPDGENGFLSNWYPSKFYLDMVQYQSVGQYLMYQKAVLFGDQETADKIIDEMDPEKIEVLAAGIQNVNENMWNGIRQILVYRGLLEKFRQNLDLLPLLMKTGHDLLAYCSEDAVWGIGLSMKNPQRSDTDAWKGENLLGYALMQARDSLRHSMVFRGPAVS